jgi:hypothetical protein
MNKLLTTSALTFTLIAAHGNYATASECLSNGAIAYLKNEIAKQNEGIRDKILPFNLASMP